jgi:3-hydroxy acid dehydrogenase/malonic semialdehyde reductase
MSGVERPPDIPPEVIRDVWATNVTGVINMTQAILPIFKQRPDGGKGDIIFLGSIAGREPYVGGTVSQSSITPEALSQLKSADILLQQGGDSGFQ